MDEWAEEGVDERANEGVDERANEGVDERADDYMGWWMEKWIDDQAVPQAC